MGRQKNRILHRCAALFLALVLIAASPCSALAQGSDGSGTGTRMESGSCGEYITVTARYREMFSNSMRDIAIDYSDEFFQRDDTVFYMDLARASFGMTVSAFRNKSEEPDPEDANILSYLDQAGFTNAESTWYDRDPTADSIASVIASKDLGGETLVALVCAGANYTMEWLSNLTVGSGTEHEGFSAAADLCEQRLTDYLNHYGIAGDVKLWVTGFSRASGVGNLLAARMTESGLFTSVYGYFFATPNNTQSPVAYPNLFNIIGQNDPVPQLPLTAWGYGRNGIDLYTPAQESNSSFTMAGMLANQACLEQTGQAFRNNPELNRQLHVVFEYLADIFPTAKDYAELLQPQLISVWQEHSGSDLIVLLREALANIRGFDIEKQSAVDALMDYLDDVIYKYVSGNEYQNLDGSWSDNVTLSANIVLEHVPAIYGSWIFSTDDPNELFVSSTEFTRLVIDGTFDLEVWDEAGIVQSISSENEEELYTPGGERRPAGTDLIYLYISNHDGKAVIDLPHDNDYTLKLRFAKNETVSLFSTDSAYGIETNNVSDVTMFTVQKGACICLQDFFSPDGMKAVTENGQNVLCIRQKLASDLQSVLAQEQLMSRNFSLTGVMQFVFLLQFTLVTTLLAALVLFLIGRRRAGRFRRAVSVCFAAAALICFTGAVFFYIILPNVPTLTAAMGILGLAFAAILVLRLRKARGGRQLSLQNGEKTGN